VVTVCANTSSAGVAVTHREKAEHGVRDLLIAIGEDPAREGLMDTPARVVKAMREMTSGYSENIAKILSVTFDSGQYDQMIVVAGISFISMCEHHLLPFSGHAAVAYLPGKGECGYRVVGLSKIPRIVEAYARRLQLQERMTTQIADALDEHLAPRGVAVVIEAEHSCMVCRGVRKAGAKMGTSEMRGSFRDHAETRAEVMQLIERCSR